MNNKKYGDLTKEEKTVVDKARKQGRLEYYAPRTDEWFLTNRYVGKCLPWAYYRIIQNNSTPIIDTNTVFTINGKEFKFVPVEPLVKKVIRIGQRYKYNPDGSVWMLVDCTKANDEDSPWASLILLDNQVDGGVAGTCWNVPQPVKNLWDITEKEFAAICFVKHSRNFELVI